MNESKMSARKCVWGVLTALAIEISLVVLRKLMLGTPYAQLIEYGANILVAAGLTAVLIGFGHARVIKENLRRFPRGLLCGAVILAYSLITFSTGLVRGIMYVGVPRSGINGLWFTLNLLLSAGICEEFMCRGVLMNFIRDAIGRNTKKGLMLSMTLSSLIFGLLHLLNLLSTVDVFGTLGQVIYAAGIGFYLAAVYARSRNIWTTVFLHFFFDLGAMIFDNIFLGKTISETSDAAVSSDPAMNAAKLISAGIIFAVSVLLGLFLIRKKKIGECFEPQPAPQPEPQPEHLPELQPELQQKPQPELSAESEDGAAQ